MTAGPLLLPPAEVVEPYAAFRLAEQFGEVLPCLVLRFRDGRRVAAGYYWLRLVDYRPDEGVRLVYPDGEYRLRGRNLLGLFTAVSEHRVKWVWEADRSAKFLTAESDPLVDAIEHLPTRG